jgi:hypothetical protein
MWYIETKTLWRSFRYGKKIFFWDAALLTNIPPFKLFREDSIMERTKALQEFRKMWTWLYKHPAHDGKYYVQHVAKPQPAWRNECPLCALAREGECQECKPLWNSADGSLCSDPASPLRQWQKTETSDPDSRSWYAGKLVDLAGQALK